MRRYLAKALPAQLRSGRSLLVLTVLGVALGVAAVLSIQILNQNAVGAFAGSVRAVSGEADLTVAGVTPGLDERLVPDVLAEAGVRGVVPLYRVEVALEPPGAPMLEVVGADLLAPVRVPWALPRAGLTGALSERGWIAVTPQLAGEMGWRVGDAFLASSGSRRLSLHVGALVDFQKLAPLASRRLAVMDLSQAQALLGVPGRIHQIDVLAAPGASVPDLARRLEARLGAAVRVVTPEQRRSEAAGLLAAFRLNLSALSLVSLLVGGFLVYASTQAALVRRREELGILRSLGATRGEVVRLIILEATLLGAAGTAAGLPLGWAAARSNLASVSATLQNVYLLEGLEQVEVSPGLYLLAVAVGLGGSIAGALLPALDIARRDPRALLAAYTLEDRAERGAVRLLAAGGSALALVLAGGLAGAGRLPAYGFAVAVAILVAVSLSAPALIQAASFGSPPGSLSIRYGIRSLAARLRTTAVAVAALAVAVSMLFGVTLLVGSFRGTVEVWLGQTLRADVYVTTPSWRRARSEATLAPEIVQRLAREPGVVAVDTLRQFYGYAGERRISIAGFDAHLAEAQGRVRLIEGDAREAMRRVRDEGAVLVSEPLARKAHLAPGAPLALEGARGGRRFPVAGVYSDYGTESGAVLMDLRTFAAAFGAGPPSNAALYLAPGLDPEEAASRLQAALAGQALEIRSNRRVREEVLAIFEQTFAVTRLLEGMGLLIAVAGITLTLLVVARERAAELALYRALGATRRQLFEVFLGRGVGMALLGLVLGAVGGVGLALVLVFLVNRAYFGWTLALHWPWRALAGEALAILAASAVASIYPAARASRTPATELSRDAL